MSDHDLATKSQAKPAAQKAKNVAPKPKQPTAGPSQDDRHGALREPEVEAEPDLRARVLKYDRIAGAGHVVISRGLAHGVDINMPAVMEGLPQVTVTIYQVEDNFCRASVDATLDMIQQHPQVIINPSTKP